MAEYNGFGFSYNYYYNVRITQVGVLLKLLMYGIIWMCFCL